jgi:7,8-dihydro-6-hydroxymethylpterin-pyrophosphokinase
VNLSNSVYLFEIDNQALSTKLGALEREYQRVQKSVDRSKKARDLDVLLNENENLQVKLEAQEDDFRLQNQTLLWELSAVSETVAVRLIVAPVRNYL